MEEKDLKIESPARPLEYLRPDPSDPPVKVIDPTFELVVAYLVLGFAPFALLIILLALLWQFVH